MSTYQKLRFIPSQYEKGISLREDVFKRQFIVEVEGEAAFEEDDSIFGYYYKDVSITCAYAETITMAIQAAIEANACECWDSMYENIDSDAAHFNPNLIKIKDRNNRIILSGYPGKEIKWHKSAQTETEIIKIKNKQQALRKEANEQQYFGSSSSSKRLNQQSYELGLLIVDRKYRNHPEIINMINRQN